MTEPSGDHSPPAPTRGITWPHRRSAGVVFVGGTLGTAARAALLAAVPYDATWPLGVFVANALGSFLLGLLVMVVARSTRSRRIENLRLLLGTGVLGGFTTYSALAADTVALASEGSLIEAVVYPLASVIIGAAAAVLGMVMGNTVASGGRR
ncbi:fluoride efflux transporter FluC [Labedella phragmitis]|uniref:fluoride efflux transporter FluC n=1 Tax=Labedella phragmitis TaxID=2498849 RepID=UPI001408911C|nr:CrcB family protein [Labedella phragmitis]